MDKQRHGITSQFIRLLMVAGLGCLLLFAVLRCALRFTLTAYADQSDFIQRETTRLVEEFQDFVTEEHLSSRDAHQITEWVQKHNFTLLELYRDHVLVYSSFAPKREIQGEQDQRVPFYDWQPYATIHFSDGDLEALLYSNTMRTYEMLGSSIFLVLCLGLFLAVFLLGCRRIVRYICLLSDEIQAMACGDLDHNITVQGSDELTTLASCLDAMRLTLRQQHQQEAETSAKVKNLITQMSHDLRTPLTTLLLYTEIVRYHKYQDEGQLRDYLAKIDRKARQIKHLSDNLFEYALVTRDTAVTLDPPAPLSQIFEGPLAELVDQIQQHGFFCTLDLGDEDLSLTVYEPYIRRILDNITSNLLKYADPDHPVSVTFVREANGAGLTFANTILSDTDSAESTKVGLVSIQTMMEKMHAETRIQRDGRQYAITLLFPLASE